MIWGTVDVRVGLAVRGKMENSGSEAPVPPGTTGETPMLPVKTTGETPVPQFCHRLLGVATAKRQA